MKRGQLQSPMLWQVETHFCAGLQQLAPATPEVSGIEMIETNSGMNQSLKKNTVWLAIALPEIFQDIMRLKVSPLVELLDSQF
jgi:hypothetical protein